MRDDSKYYIDIYLDDDELTTDSLIDEINSLSSTKNNSEEKVFMITKSKKEDKKSKKKKKKKNSLFTGAFDVPEDNEESPIQMSEEDADILLDVEEIMKDIEEENIDDDIIGEQKKGYKKLKKQENYKKEFAEELTLLYNLLDETSKFGKELEKKYKALDGQKVRGVSKYTNDLGQLVLTAKANKLSILKEISGVKKTIADLQLKDAKNNTNDNKGTSSPEYLANAYFKNILSHGRTDFIKRMADDDSQDAFIDQLETRLSMGYEGLTEPDISDYEERLEQRLRDEPGFRSEAGDKYIKYENLGVQIRVKKCIDTGEWEFYAIDKYNNIVADYPVPTKREAGRMKFSDDGNYCTDEKGRMYSVQEYYLPDEEYDVDDDDDE